MHILKLKYQRVWHNVVITYLTLSLQDRIQSMKEEAATTAVWQLQPGDRACSHRMAHFVAAGDVWWDVCEADAHWWTPELKLLHCNERIIFHIIYLFLRWSPWLHRGWRNTTVSFGRKEKNLPVGLNGQKTSFSFCLSSSSVILSVIMNIVYNVHCLWILFIITTVNSHSNNDNRTIYFWSGSRLFRLLLER